MKEPVLFRPLGAARPTETGDALALIMLQNVGWVCQKSSPEPLRASLRASLRRWGRKSGGELTRELSGRLGRR